MLAFLRFEREDLVEGLVEESFELFFVFTKGGMLALDDILEMSADDLVQRDFAFSVRDLEEAESQERRCRDKSAKSTWESIASTSAEAEMISSTSYSSRLRAWLG